jgi:hypothetical protein
MTIFSVETWIIKPDKLGEHAAWAKKFEEYMKKHAELFKEVKSVKVFSHALGGKWGGLVFMTEYENLADFEKLWNKVMKSDFMTTLYPEWASLIVAGSYSIEIWNSAQ